MASVSNFDQTEPKPSSRWHATTRRATIFATVLSNMLGVAMIAFIALTAHAVPFPTCTELANDPDYGLAGNAHIVLATLNSVIVPAAPAVPPSAYEPTATPATPAYCLVNFTFSSGLSGPVNGYDVDQTQMIEIRISLPLNSADGGSGGVEGNWVGKLMVSASPGSSGSVTAWTNYAEGLDHDTGPVYAIRLGYVGASTDTGQHNPPFGVIQTGPLAHTLALGTIADWAYRGTHYGKQWAATVAQTYYGQAPTRTYFNGCSGGGNEGMGQLQHYGNEYDGFLIGSAAYHWQQFWLATSWPNLVFKELIQQGGVLPTVDQMNVVTASAIASCDVEGLDTVKDGIIADPRACTFSAKANVCGAATAPAAPACLAADQAAAIDRIWDGPRNHFGLRIEYPYDRGIAFGAGNGISISSSVPAITAQVMQWDHKDLTFNGNNLFADAESLALAGNPSNGITYEDEATLGAKTIDDYTDNQNAALNLAARHGTKVIQLHGTIDGIIRWRQDVDYYRRVGTWYGYGRLNFDALQSWYRLFMIPGVGHCTGALDGGPGPSPLDPFQTLVNWVEKGVAPQSITARGGAGAPPMRTRPLCPFPKTAIYNGSGSSDDATNFHCGGNLETPRVVCDDLLTQYKNENGDLLDVSGVNAQAEHCESSVGRNGPKQSEGHE